jgi:hypothetical protein
MTSVKWAPERITNWYLGPVSVISIRVHSLVNRIKTEAKGECYCPKYVPKYHTEIVLNSLPQPCSK